ncbi:3-keto-steroid reductase-like [Carassius auratus]|uniref:3-keto-steroid reductase-like n=1 Tax=Carassius auratus TaxID=7957 RepID=A0A6P6KFU6_CARAU|nr:3-keto-steroid reductase-like [Carassius auratus]
MAAVQTPSLHRHWIKKVVLLTGANSGIVLALCERLLSRDAQLQLCLACRNMQRAEAARQALLVPHPRAQATLLHLDVANMRSVLRAAEEFKQIYNRLDHLYLNAGIMPNPRVDHKASYKGLFSRYSISFYIHLVHSIYPENKVTSIGLQEVFDTNLFGHLLLVLFFFWRYLYTVIYIAVVEHNTVSVFFI